MITTVSQTIMMLPSHPRHVHSSHVAADQLQDSNYNDSRSEISDDLAGKGTPALTLSGDFSTADASIHLDHAEALKREYKIHGDIQLLQRAIELERSTMNSAEMTDTDRATSCRNLADSLFTLFARLGGDHLLEEAIGLAREGLDLLPTGQPLQRAALCARLSNLIGAKYICTGQKVYLVEAIELVKESSALCPPDIPERAAYCRVMARTLWSSYTAAGTDLSLLLEAITFGREALTLDTKASASRAESCGNLSSSLYLYDMYNGSYGNLVEAIDLAREALTITGASEGHPDHADACLALAGPLSLSFSQSGDPRSLVEAVDMERRALKLRSSEDPSRSMYYGNLAGSLCQLFEHTDDYHHLDEAISLQREGITLLPIGHPDRVNWCSNLAQYLLMYYEHTKDVTLLDEAIELQREAMALNSGHAMCRANLANALKTRYELTKDRALLDEIMQLARAGISLAPSSLTWRLSGFDCWARLHLNDSIDHITEAIADFCARLDDGPDDIAQVITEFSKEIGKFLDRNIYTRERCSALTPLYSHLIRLLPFLLNTTLDVKSQLHVFRECSHLGVDAFVNASLGGDWRPGLESLELAQGLMWSQRLRYRDPELDDIPPILSSDLEIVLKAIGKPSMRNQAQGSAISDTLPTSSLTPAPSPQDTAFQQFSRLHTLLRQIRALPGLHDFMLGDSLETLLATASLHPVVVLVGAQGHYYALILTPEQEKHRLLPIDWKEQELHMRDLGHILARSHRSSTYAVSSFQEDHDRGLTMRRTTPATALIHRMKMLWNNVVKPTLDYLGIQQASKGELRPRLYWCPTGIFNAIPLHAAGIYEGTQAQRVCCSDYVVSSYTTTLTGLSRAQKAAEVLSREHLSVTLLAERHARDPALPILHGVDHEVEEITNVAASRDITIAHRLFDLKTVAKTTSAIQAANIVHLACHGIQDNDDAAQSGFCLGDGRLTISQLMELRFEKAHLAFLSACETAKGDSQHPDQVMHLAAAMLFAGFKSVIATMWAIDDSDGPQVARWFYEELFSSEEITASKAAYALDTAVQKLRHSGAPLDRWAPFIHMGA